MPKVYAQAYFGAKKGLVASGKAVKGSQDPEELTQEECEAIVAERQASNDGVSYTIEP